MSEIFTEFIGTSRNPKKRKRYATLAAPDTQALATLSGEWRDLLTQCVKNGENARWDTWLKIAGIARKTLVEQLRDWLVKHGWLRVYEEKRSGDWWAYKLEVLHFSVLQHALGLVQAGAQKLILQTLLNQLENLQDASLQLALDNLQTMPASRAITRAILVQYLLDWIKEERVGTYRDFSLFARGATKEISQAEWAWLDDHFDLAEFNIERHTPLLLISANLILHTKLGETNLGTAPDFAALTPATVKSIQFASGEISTWILVENRTSFERVARNRQADEGVIWLPGYPPNWWKEAVKHVINIAPAPAKIACDPDPAGIAIALSAIALWREAGLEAAAWKMGAKALESLSSKKPLSDFDQQQLASLLKQDLPVELRVLAEYMQERQQKGEQEGYL
ncbi:MAG: hypothetical protein CVU29_02770 [Betaproteobacteria bacterium HGW-Betaproteobacteria-22]|nr:MAG: hypothetical protein CVU29_02770 [Betaproteobacteria bacterium HGW-Betaproteobacteria-22]